MDYPSTPRTGRGDARNRGDGIQMKLELQMPATPTPTHVPTNRIELSRERECEYEYETPRSSSGSTSMATAMEIAISAEKEHEEQEPVPEETTEDESGDESEDEDTHYTDAAATIETSFTSHSGVEEDEDEKNDENNENENGENGENGENARIQQQQQPQNSIQPPSAESIITVSMEPPPMTPVTTSLGSPELYVVERTPVFTTPAAEAGAAAQIETNISTPANMNVTATPPIIMRTPDTLSSLRYNTKSNTNGVNLSIRSRFQKSSRKKEKSLTLNLNANENANANSNDNATFKATSNASAKEKSSFNAATTTPAKSKATATKTLAALFGAPVVGNINAPGDTDSNYKYNISNAHSNHHLNSPAAQHDYTLVGDSPYETTYDPQSPYYYNRVYGQLYITTVSVMFRGKAFGPIGAIPFERRLLLPFVEITTIEAYKTTSVKITMHDGENYVFKSFANREAVVKLLQRTQAKCRSNSDHRRRRIGVAGATTIVAVAPHKPQAQPRSSHQLQLQSDASLTSSEEEHESQSRHSTNLNQSYTDKSSSNSNTLGEDVLPRSQSEPSSLRSPKSARDVSITTVTPRQNLLFTADATTCKRNNRRIKTVEKEILTKTMTKTPKSIEKRAPDPPKPRLMPANSLRLSLSGDRDSDSNRAEVTKEANAAGHGDPTRPRRLFALDKAPSTSTLASTSTSVASTSAAASSSIMLSPPRTRISQRRKPKTPQVIVVLETPTQPIDTALRDRDHSGNSTGTGGTLASIPSIPTVPTLNTPQPRFQAQERIINIHNHDHVNHYERRTATLSATESSRGSKAASMMIPLPITEIANDGPSPPAAEARAVAGAGAPLLLAAMAPAPFTPIGNHSPAHTTHASVSSPDSQRQREREKDARVEQAWQSALRANPTTQKDWQVAMAPIKLPNCTLDDWFDLFFSDDAVFSLARYQIANIGDRDVSCRSWRRKRKPTPEAPSNGNTNNHNTNSNEEPEHDGIPELEREISYIHPIGGKAGMSMIGPSEAETFRVQSLKRYGNHGAILKNVTTVGESIPMSDCFRVEDKWIIAIDEKSSQDPSQSSQVVTLKLSVVFRVVFVKRTMFKGMIQKNTLSGTKEWFGGYSKMLHAALESPEHQELRRQRLEQEQANNNNACSVPVPIPRSVSSASINASQSPGTRSSSPSSSLATKDDSISTTKASVRRVGIGIREGDSDNDNTGSPHSTISAGTSSQRSYRSDTNAREDIATATANRQRQRQTRDPLERGDSDRHKYSDTNANVNVNAFTNSNPFIKLVPVVAIACICVAGIMIAAVVALWLQVQSVGMSLSLVEGRLGELQAQNTMLLQKLEELSLATATSTVTVAVPNENSNHANLPNFDASVDKTPYNTI